MRVFQEEIFGPVLAVTTCHGEAEAIEIANDTLYGLGAGVWTRYCDGGDISDITEVAVQDHRGDARPTQLALDGYVNRTASAPRSRSARYLESFRPNGRWLDPRIAPHAPRRTCMVWDLRPCWHGGVTRNMDECRVMQVGGWRVLPHITDWRAELAPYYDQAERMLGVVPNPTLTPSDEVMKQVAGEMGIGHTFGMAPVGVFFGRDGRKEPGAEADDPLRGFSCRRSPMWYGDSSRSARIPRACP